MSGNMNSKRTLEGMRAIVTGGSRGIGAAIVHELATLGADVTLMGRDLKHLRRYRARLAREFDQGFHAVQVDVTSPGAVKEAFDVARDAMGDAQILVNNAGAVETTAFIKADLDHWQRMMDVNLNSVFLTCQEVLPAMLDAGQGRIVNIASTAGVQGHPYVSAYAAAKHGVVGLTRSLALELARKGITVNAICPGYTETDLIVESARKVARETGREPEEIIEKLKQANPTGRLIQPAEVARKVGWLCLPEQAPVTGQAIVIDGGDNA